MPDRKTIVCLANSRKNNGHCVAGKVIVDGLPGPWVRPVSARPTRELTWAERAYPGMIDPSLLDLIEVPLLRPHPEGHQAENQLIARDETWQRAGNLTYRDLAPYVDFPTTLWGGATSSSTGINDRIPASEAGKYHNSLYLIAPDACFARVGIPVSNYGRTRRKVYVHFEYRDIPYAIPLTDPTLEKEFLARQNGDYPLANTYITVSLGEPFEGYCYKLAAALFRP